MTRAVILLTGLLFATACDVGTVPLTGPGGTTPDGGSAATGDGGGTTGDGASAGIVAKARSANINPAHVHSGGGGTNAGLDCMTCHAQGGAANIVFQIAGTLYDTVGTADTGGAIVEIQVGGAGAVTDIITDTAGNFYIGPGEGDGIGSGLAAAFPARVAVTAAPTLTPMSEEVASTGGGCNSCHMTPPTGGASGPLTLN